MHGDYAPNNVADFLAASLRIDLLQYFWLQPVGILVKMRNKIKEQEIFKIVMMQVDQNQFEIVNNIHEEIQEVKDVFDRKLQFVENTISQRRQYICIDVIRHWTESRDEGIN